MFEGKAVKLNQLDNGVVELVFDYVEESVNKFDRTALEDWRTSVDLLQEKSDNITGLLSDLPKVNPLSVLTLQNLVKRSNKQMNSSVNGLHLQQNLQRY